MLERIHNNRQGLILGVAVLFLLLLVPYMLMIRPQADDIAFQQGEVTRLQQENEIFGRKIEELKGAGAAELSDEEVTQKLPSSANQEQIVSDLYKVGLATNVILSDATFADNIPGSESATSETQIPASGSVAGVYVTVNIQSDYNGIKAWMKAIQNLPRITSIEQFSFNKPYVFNGSLLEATVTFKASYLPQAQASAAPEATTGDTGTSTDAATETTP